MGAPEHDDLVGDAPTVATRFELAQRAGGLAGPVLTTLLAFVVGGLIVLATGANPFSTYRAIFDGSGLNWLFPWVRGADRAFAAGNLQQTLLLTTALLLCGLAVGFAFRSGLFNIGGQGQYLVGSILSVWIGSSLVGMDGPLHILLTIAAATLGGALYAGLAGLLKATVGAHEVITTIMLNWIAVWVGSWLFGDGGALQSHAGGGSLPTSPPVAESVHLPVFWGSAELQGLDIGFFVALACLVVYALTLSRTALGFEVRAVGFNPEASRYAGMSVARTYVAAMAVAGAFAGLAGAVDVLGWQFSVGVNDIQTSQIGFIAIAVAVLGRNRPLGILLSALLFGALLNGTATRNIDPAVFRPELASNLTLIIQGLVILFVGADVLVLWLWSRRPRRAVAAA
jgi:simple sugar transport system permease protein